jgi:hypothetical protein
VPDRPGPSLNRWLELVAPPEDLAEIDGWLSLLIDYIRGCPPPVSVRQPAVSRKLAAYADLVHRASVDFEAARHRAAATAQACAPAARGVLAPAQLLSSSEAPKITVAQAAGLLGVKAQRIRQLAGSGRISGRKIARDTWELDRGSVIAYGEQRRHGRGDGGGTAPGRPEGGDGGRGSRGGAAAA